MVCRAQAALREGGRLREGGLGRRREDRHRLPRDVDRGLPQVFHQGSSGLLDHRTAIHTLTYLS
eukprot:12468567-Heterocapsa_arctica.AAC.1